jgi:hypothetical protein
LLEHPSQAGDDALARLMVAASATTATDTEREQAALVAFRAAAPVRLSPTARRPSMLKSLLANAAAAKILASAAVAAAATGGVALAANGSLPLSFGSDTPATATAAASGSATMTTTPPTESSDESSSSVAEDSPAPTESTDVPSPSAMPSPSLIGLCNAYRSGVATSNGAALKNPAFSVLIQAAAGEDNVGDFCQKLLATRPGNHGKPGDLPGKPSDLPGKPSERPGEPGQLPGDDDGDLPGNPGNGSTDHPTGPPSSNPGKGNGRGVQLPGLQDESF